MNESQAVDALARAAFPYRAAAFVGDVPELGPTLEVLAFDVPEDACVDVSAELQRLLRAAAQGARVLGGVFDVVESAERASSLPVQVLWYQPAIRGVGAADPPLKNRRARGLQVRDRGDTQSGPRGSGA